MPRKKTSRPILEFRVYPGESKVGLHGLYFTVVVFNTLAELRHHAKHKNGARYGTRGMLATVQGWTRFVTQAKVDGGRTTKMPEMGEILLAKRHCNVRVVAHECVHAMMRWIERKGIDQKWLNGDADGKVKGLCGDHEESMAYAVGDLSAQIYSKLYEHEVIAN